MATSVTVYGGQGYASAGLSASIGGAATAGDLLVVVVSQYGTGSAGDPVLADDVSGATGWSKVINHLGDSGDGSTDFHATYWTKVCVGGEANVSVTPSTGTPDMAFNGACVRTPTQPNLYIIDQGEEALVGGRNQFTCTNAPQTNNETYVLLTANGTIPLVSTDMSDPGSTGGAAQLLTGAANTVVVFSTNEGANNTGQRPVAFDLQTALLFNYAAFFGITTHGPTADLAGTGEILVDGTGDLETGGGAVELEGSGEALVDGTGLLQTTGGNTGLAGLGRPGVGGSGRLVSILPNPPPGVPDRANTLECGIYEVLIFTRGLGEIVGMLPFGELDWGRVLDGVSVGNVTVDGVANRSQLQKCCRLLGEVEPFEHELAIYRNGYRCWSGPITAMSFPPNQVQISAFDLSGWLQRRTLHTDYNAVQVDLIDIWVNYVQDAMSVDNSMGLHPTALALSGILADRLTQITEHNVALDAIGELERTGIDWTTVDRVMQAGPVLTQPPPITGALEFPLLIDESFRVAPTILVDGMQGANCWYVQGGAAGAAGAVIFGEYGPAFEETPDHVAQPAAPDYAAIEDQYGRLESVTSESRALDQPSIDANAKSRYELTRRPVPVISEGLLLPSAPIAMRKLVPGSLVQVHLANACKPIGDFYRIKSVKVQAHGDGSEDVNVEFQPLGTGTVLGTGDG